MYTDLYSGLYSECRVQTQTEQSDGPRSFLAVRLSVKHAVLKHRGEEFFTEKIGNITDEICSTSRGTDPRDITQNDDTIN